MKHIILILLAGSILFACKKDKQGSEPKVSALSKIFQDDKLLLSYTYSPQKKITREDSYDEVTGVLEYATVFEYDASGHMVVEKQYYPGDKIIGRVNYQWDGNKLKEYSFFSLSGADSGQIVVRVKYSYDMNDRIGRMSWIDLVTEKVYTSRDLYYHDNGSLKSSEVYYYLSGKKLQWKTEYGPDVDTLPADLMNLGGYQLDFRQPEFTTGESHFYRYDGGPLNQESKQVFSNRKHNSKGYLVRQIVTETSILPAGFPTDHEMRYEYTEL